MCFFFILFQVKFGVRREWVPFVLASDFEHIIEKHFGFNAYVYYLSALEFVFQFKQECMDLKNSPCTLQCYSSNAYFTDLGFISVIYLLRRFANLCEQAYLILRRRAPLLINLLAMMLQTGIPELQSMDDLNYVR